MSLEKELNLERPMQDPKHEAVLNVVRTASLLSLKGSDLFRKFGLTEAQFNVLFSLKYKENVWTNWRARVWLPATRWRVTGGFITSI
jgi:hypothetical protein